MTRGSVVVDVIEPNAAEPKLPFGGADLLARGLGSGRAIGETLKRFQASWIRAGFPKDPALLTRLLDEALEEAAAIRRES